MYVTFRRSVRLISGLRRREGVLARATAAAPRAEATTRSPAEPELPATASGAESPPEAEAETVPASASRTWA